MRTFQMALATAALCPLVSSAFSTTVWSRPSTILRAESSPETPVPDFDFKTQWKVDNSFTTTSSGLIFRDIVVGSGESPDEGGTIEIHYAFWFDTFDNADDTTGKLYFNTRNERNLANKPLGFQYTENAKILKGWIEGMKTMKQGGTRLLIIPPDLGYGDDEFPEAPGYPAIPSRSHLRFEVELVSVDNSAWTKFRRMVPKPSAMFEG